MNRNNSNKKNKVDVDRYLYIQLQKDRTEKICKFYKLWKLFLHEVNLNNVSRYIPPISV